MHIAMNDSKFSLQLGSELKEGSKNGFFYFQAAFWLGTTVCVRKRSSLEQVIHVSLGTKEGLARP